LPCALRAFPPPPPLFFFWGPPPPPPGPPPALSLFKKIWGGPPRLSPPPLLGPVPRTGGGGGPPVCSRGARSPAPSGRRTLGLAFRDQQVSLQVVRACERAVLPERPQGCRPRCGPGESTSWTVRLRRRRADLPQRPSCRA